MTLTKYHIESVCDECGEKAGYVYGPAKPGQEALFYLAADVEARIAELEGEVIDAQDQHEKQLVEIYEALGGDLEWTDPSGVFGMILAVIEEGWQPEKRQRNNAEASYQREVYALKYSNDRLREQITALQHENALLSAQRPPAPTQSACGHYDCNEEDCYGK